MLGIGKALSGFLASRWSTLVIVGLVIGALAWAVDFIGDAAVHEDRLERQAAATAAAGAVNTEGERRHAKAAATDWATERSRRLRGEDGAAVYILPQAGLDLRPGAEPGGDDRGPADGRAGRLAPGPHPGEPAGGPEAVRGPLPGGADGAAPADPRLQGYSLLDLAAVGFGSVIVTLVAMRLFSRPRREVHDVTITEAIRSRRPLLGKEASQALFRAFALAMTGIAGYLAINVIDAKADISALTTQNASLERKTERLIDELDEVSRAVRENTNAIQRLIGKLEGRI